VPQEEPQAGENSGSVVLPLLSETNRPGEDFKFQVKDGARFRSLASGGG
jgi:hypothetical protein